MSSPSSFPRMLVWWLASIALMVVALMAHKWWPGTLMAVSIYKAHLMALGGWGGYWLDRALFPYDRPHTHLDFERWRTEEPAQPGGDEAYLQVSTDAFSLGMLRRSIIVAACLICVGLGA